MAERPLSDPPTDSLTTLAQAEREAWERCKAGRKQVPNAWLGRNSGDADGGVMDRQSAGAVCDARHSEPLGAAWFKPAGGCFHFLALARDAS